MTTINRIDLSPPVGYGKGLPLSLPMNLSGSWETESAGIAGNIDADPSLWSAYRNTQMPATFGATWMTGYSVYDSVRGYIWSSQIINGQAPAPGSLDSDSAFMSYGMATGLFYSSPGRTRAMPVLNAMDRSGVAGSMRLYSNLAVGDGSGTPGNYTHQSGPVEATSAAMLLSNRSHVIGTGGYGRMYDRATGNLAPSPHDTAVGTKLSIFNGSESACVTYASQVCLPSGGNGKQWGDSHDTIYNTTLGASAFSIHMHPDYSYPLSMKGLHIGRWNMDRNYTEPAHWVVNLYSHGHYPHARQPRGSATGYSEGAATRLDNPSSPPGIAEVDMVVTDPGDGTDQVTYHDRDMANWTQPTETAHAILTHERIGTVKTVKELGPAHLGNHVVMDSTGLIGFEGVFTASAFFSISEDKERDGTTGAHSYSQGMHFAGLNIQVTSGTPARRAGGRWLPTGMRGFRYGSDGELIAPMSDSMITTGSMKMEDGTVPIGHADYGLDHNRTTFFVGRMGMDTMTRLGWELDERPHSIPSGGDIVTARGGTSKHYIVGDTQALPRAFGSASTQITGTDMVGTEKVGTRWMADYIPTKVQIVPSVVGWIDRIVEPGSEKESNYVATGPMPANPEPITFKQPIVDYHVLVSLCEKDGNIASFTAEDLSTRNAPQFTDLSLDMSLDGRPAVIMHSIFRINPNQLEQLYCGDGVRDFGGGKIVQTNNGFDQVLPRHSYGSTPHEQGWGLHQVTPFRPIRNQDWTAIPKFTEMESGGMYQRGGISHLWDADVYGGELFVAATLGDCSDLGGGTPTTDPKTGKNWFGDVWKYGQKWAGSNPELPPGKELMIFRYSPVNDPYYPTETHTTKQLNPIYERFNAAGLANYLEGGFDSTLHNDGHTSALNGLTWATAANARREGTDGRSWALHDWVFPRVELMRYLGSEDKGSPSTYPRLACGGLRIMEDGRMMMAAIHRDIITSTDQYPDGSIGYPFNPDNSYPRCPPGYYYDGSACVPMMGTDYTADTPGNRLDPDSETETSEAMPTPVTPPSASDPSTASTTVFGDFPTYAKLVTGSGARSLILLWSDAKAKKGKVVSGLCDFSGQWISDNAGGWTWKQTFNRPDTWWNGSRISYWYPESGQRAIPCVYGAYPEIRLSNVTLPRAMPARGVNGVIEGYPIQQRAGREMVGTIGHLYGHADTGTQFSIIDMEEREYTTTGLGSLWTNQRMNLRRQWYVPTTYGLTDFASGSKPYYHKGWASWALPLDLIDPAWKTDGSLFPSEGSNAVQQPLSGFSASMGVMAGFDYFPNLQQLSATDPLLDQEQAIFYAWDFGQFERYPSNSVTGTPKGEIVGYIQGGSFFGIAPVAVADVGSIRDWMAADPASPFSNATRWGAPMVEASRIVQPHVIRTGDLWLNEHTGIVISLDNGGGGEERMLVEPHIQQPRNLIDPTVFIPIPPPTGGAPDGGGGGALPDPEDPIDPGDGGGIIIEDPIVPGGGD